MRVSPAVRLTLLLFLLLLLVSINPSHSAVTINPSVSDGGVMRGGNGTRTERDARPARRKTGSLQNTCTAALLNKLWREDEIVNGSNERREEEEEGVKGERGET